jgi:excisionase family DNA binding protein
VPEQEQLLTVSEAARRMGVSPKIVQSMVTRRDLPAVVFGNRTRIPASAVQVYVDKIERAAAIAREMAKSKSPEENQP